MELENVPSPSVASSALEIRLALIVFWSQRARVFVCSSFKLVHLIFRAESRAKLPARQLQARILALPDERWRWLGSGQTRERERERVNFTKIALRGWGLLGPLLGQFRSRSWAPILSGAAPSACRQARNS